MNKCILFATSFCISAGASTAATLTYDDADRATAINDLIVGGQTYQVSFNYEAYNTAYPQGRIFSNAQDISAAIVGVLEAENPIPLIGVNGFSDDPDRVQAAVGFVLPSSPTDYLVTRCPSFVLSGGSALNDGGFCADGYTETFTGNLTFEMETMWAIVSGGTFEGGGTTSPSPPSASIVPLPATLPLLIGGIAGLGWYARRRRS